MEYPKTNVEAPNRKEALAKIKKILEEAKAAVAAEREARNQKPEN
jgi:hypothetical protein